MRKFTKDDTFAAALLILLTIPVVYISFFVPFEGESGDNIVHYFFARYAFENPRLYLDLWAKPIFTLLASPFAQLGFEGIKLFNGLVALFSALVAYLAARNLRFQYPWLAIIFVFFAPTYFVITFSAYTEPLFGLFLISALYLAIRGNYTWAAILISFAPFIRAEGYFIIAIFGLYFLLKKKWKLLPFLVTGILLLGLAGVFTGKNIAWVFTEIPYAVKSQYGSGRLTHYANQWLMMVGVPLSISSIAGLVLLLNGLTKRKEITECRYWTELYFLLPALFIAYFMFHTLSWYLGLFTSYGLIRVLVPLVPLQAVISLFSIQYILRINLGRKWFSPLLLIIFLVYVMVFPFLHNPASINWKKDFRQEPKLVLMNQIAREIKDTYSGKNLYYSEPYMSYALNINHFDPVLHTNFTEIKKSDIKPNSIIVWDNWTSVNFCQNRLDFEGDSLFQLVKTYRNPKSDREDVFKLYLRK